MSSNSVKSMRSENNSYISNKTGYDNFDEETLGSMATIKRIEEYVSYELSKVNGGNDGIRSNVKTVQYGENNESEAENRDSEISSKVSILASNSTVADDASVEVSIESNPTQISRDRSGNECNHSSELSDFFKMEEKKNCRSSKAPSLKSAPTVLEDVCGKKHVEARGDDGDLNGHGDNCLASIAKSTRSTKTTKSSKSAMSIASKRSSTGKGSISSISTVRTNGNLTSKQTEATLLNRVSEQSPSFNELQENISKLGNINTDRESASTSSSSTRSKQKNKEIKSSGSVASKGSGGSRRSQKSVTSDEKRNLMLDDTLKKLSSEAPDTISFTDQMAIWENKVAQLGLLIDQEKTKNKKLTQLEKALGEKKRKFQADAKQAQWKFKVGQLEELLKKKRHEKISKLKKLAKLLEDLKQEKSNIYAVYTEGRISICDEDSHSKTSSALSMSNGSRKMVKSS